MSDIDNSYYFFLNNFTAVLKQVSLSVNKTWLSREVMCYAIRQVNRVMLASVFSVNQLTLLLTNGQSNKTVIVH